MQPVPRYNSHHYIQYNGTFSMTMELFSKIWGIIISHDHGIMLDNRVECKFEFAIMLLGSANVHKKVTFVVPERFARKFKFIVEEDSMHHIAIKIKGDHQHSDNESKELGDIISSPVGQFFDCKEYRVWQNNFSNNSTMKKTDLDALEASEILDQYGPQFVESVVVLVLYNQLFVFHPQQQSDR